MSTLFDPLKLSYPSRRYPIYAKGGMVNCSCPQASAAGLEALRRGGNAVDAAVAAAAALTVTEPTANGLGSDAFAILWSEKDQKLYGLNSSGKSPALISPEQLDKDGLGRDGKMPRYGWAPVTVPGAVKAWAELNRRFGRLTLEEVLKPAIRYAAEGYPCSPAISGAWEKAFVLYQKELKAPCFEEWFRTFAPQGRAPRPGEPIRLPDHAATLEEIAQSRGESFYSGRLARQMDAESRKYGGYLRFEDLAAHEVLWVEPLSVSYRGFEVCELPPNGQGIVALMALNLLNQFRLTEKESVEIYHRQIEAMKMSFADAFHFVTDPAHMQADPRDYLQESYARERAARMQDMAQVWSHGTPPKSGTVYLCCADGEGNMVSYIQSNYMGFGSGIVVEGTGIALQNRGADFSLNPANINYLRPGKRSYHTIIPGFLMKDGKPLGPFGVMGGYMQPQGHVQVVSNLLDFHLNPQQAIDAPRWQWMREGHVVLEPGFAPEIIAGLRQRGHQIEISENTASFGRGQMILRQPDGVLVGGTESRTDSNIACF